MRGSKDGSIPAMAALREPSRTASSKVLAKALVRSLVRADPNVMLRKTGAASEWVR